MNNIPITVTIKLKKNATFESFNKITSNIKIIN